MAIFNPDVPEGKAGIPDWTKITKPISGVEADRSTGIALATAGNALEGAAGLVDMYANETIKKDVRKTIEPIREDYTDQLLKAKAIIQGTDNVTGPNTTNAGGDLMEGVGPTGPEIPQAIKQGLSRVASIQNFINSNGKAIPDQTYYDMRLKNAVTNLRDRYPAYVDKIDSEVGRIVGMNPANELINDTQRQIAQLQTSKKTEYDKWVDIARKAVGELGGGEQMYTDLIRKGEAGLPAYMSWYATESRKWSAIKEQETLRTFRKNTDADFQETRTKDWTNEAGTAVSTAMNTTLKLTGMDESKKATDLMQDMSEHPENYDAMKAKEFATRLLAQKASVIAQLKARASEMKTDAQGNKYSYNSDITAPKVDEVIKSVASYYDQMHDALWNGGAQGAGMAFYWAQRAAAQLDMTKSKIYDGDTGEDLRMWHVLKTDFGDAAVPSLMQSATKANLDTKINGLFENRMLKAKTTPPDAPAAVTFKSMGDESLTYVQNKQITERMRARYLGAGMETMMKDITDKDTPDNAKVNALRFFFSPQGQNALGHFKDDYYDYAKRVNIPGRQTIWGKFTSDTVANEVARLSKSDPTVGDMYSKWIKNEAASQLYYKEFQDLNRITGHDDLNIKFHDAEKGGVPYIELTDKNGVALKARPPTPGVYSTSRPESDPGYIHIINQKINRLNDALAGVYRVDKALGNGNANAEMLSFLISSQVDLGKNWSGLPAKIMDAIAASQGKGKLKDVLEQGVTK